MADFNMDDFDLNLDDLEDNVILSLYFHFIWETLDRQPLLTGERKATVYQSVHAECECLKVKMLAIGGTENHVHLLVNFLTDNLSMDGFMDHIQGASAQLIQRQMPSQIPFQWEADYGVYSISRGDVPALTAYIDKQTELHRDGTFDPELELEFSE